MTLHANASRQQRRPIRRAGFTLIELLVVIAIIAVLIALCSPRCRRPRGRSTDAVHQQPQADRPGPIQLREQSGALPPAGKSTYFASNPPDAQFVDGVGMLPRLPPYVEATAAFNAINFSVDYNHISGANFTGYSTVVSAYLCPSANREPAGGRDAVDPNDPAAVAAGIGYGVTDYAAICATTIDPLERHRWSVQYADRDLPELRLTNGMLKQSMTRLAEVTDGLSQTLVVTEDAGSRRTVRQRVLGVLCDAGFERGSARWPGQRRFWRWAEPDSAIVSSTVINNKGTPSHENTQYPTTNTTAGNSGRPRTTRSSASIPAV